MFNFPVAAYKSTNFCRNLWSVSGLGLTQFPKPKWMVDLAEPRPSLWASSNQGSKTIRRSVNSLGTSDWSRSLCNSNRSEHLRCLLNPSTAVAGEHSVVCFLRQSWIVWNHGLVAFLQWLLKINQTSRWCQSLAFVLAHRRRCHHEIMRSTYSIGIIWNALSSNSITRSVHGKQGNKGLKQPDPTTLRHSEANILVHFGLRHFITHLTWIAITVTFSNYWLKDA